jgi:membrane-bound metal-dependent hydrolase YbcI (DUF457 family)
VFVLSILPDVDLLIPGLKHRGAIHSVILQTIVFIPFFLYYKKQTMPYYVALVQHSLLGDYLVGGGVQIFWPLTASYYGFDVPITSLAGTILELAGFVVAVVLMFFSGDLHEMLFKPRKENLLLLLPCGAILASVFLFWRNSIPAVLLVPHLMFLAIFTVAILASFRNFVFNCFQLS